MKEQIRDVLGYNDQSFKVPMLMYESAAEADKAAGREGATVDECNNNLAYRGSYADARELIVDCVQELTKEPFLQVDTGEKDDKGAPIMERDTDKDSDAKYVKRALAAHPEVSFEAVQNLVTKRARGWEYKDDKGQTVKIPAIAVDITKKTRTPAGPKKLAAKFSELAKGIIKAGSVPKFNKASSKYGIAAFTPTGDVDKDVTTLGWLCKAYSDAKAQEAQNEFALPMK